MGVSKSGKTKKSQAMHLVGTHAKQIHDPTVINSLTGRRSPASRTKETRDMVLDKKCVFGSPRSFPITY